MLFLYVITYWLIITSLGMHVARKLILNAGWIRLTSAHLIGSIILGVFIFALTHLQLIYSVPLFSLIFICAILGIFQLSEVFISAKIGLIELYHYVFEGYRYQKLLLLALTILIVWIVLLADTPARAGDAMRYHLAISNDILKHHGAIFRPYVNANFPLYFNDLFFPVFYIANGLIAKGIGIQLVVASYFFLTIVNLLVIARSIHIKHPALLLFALFLTPALFQNGTAVYNNIPTIYYVTTGLLLLQHYKQQQQASIIYLAFLSLGFSLGIRYQAGAFIPWFVLIAYYNFRKINSLKNTILQILIGLFLLVVVASPFYVRNYINLGNPIWPLAPNLFSYHDEYLHQITAFFNNGVTGKHNLSSLLGDLHHFLFDPLIPITFWCLIFAGAIFSKRNELRLDLGCLFFFSIWYLIQPEMHLHYGIIFYPIGLLAAISLYDRIEYSKSLKVIYITLYQTSLIIGILMAVIYSMLFIQYQLNHNLKDYMKYTWFYDSFDKANHLTPKNSTFLVITPGSQSYYLDRKLYIADSDSALIHWPDIKSNKQFYNLLKKMHINYILYSLENMNGQLNLDDIVHVMNQFSHSHYARIIFSRSEILYISQFRHTLYELIKSIQWINQKKCYEILVAPYRYKATAILLKVNGAS